MIYYREVDFMKQKRMPDGLQGLKLYTLSEIEPILGVSHRTLLSYVKNGTLHAVKIGGKWKVTEKELKRLINGK